MESYEHDIMQQEAQDIKYEQFLAAIGPELEFIKSSLDDMRILAVDRYDLPESVVDTLIEEELL